MSTGCWMDVKPGSARLRSMRAVDAIVDASSFAVLLGRGHCNGNPTLYRVVLSD
jgi:hypothetical protein